MNTEITAAQVTDETTVEETPEETVEELTVDQVVDGLLEGVADGITAYKVAVYINGAFEVLGLEKRIPTQMMYNYTKNGLIAKGKKGKASDIRYTVEEVKTYMNKYVSKYAQ
jgi:hypothetical protein